MDPLWQRRQPRSDPSVLGPLGPEAAHDQFSGEVLEGEDSNHDYKGLLPFVDLMQRSKPCADSPVLSLEPRTPPAQGPPSSSQTVEESKTDEKQVE